MAVSSESVEKSGVLLPLLETESLPAGMWPRSSSDGRSISGAAMADVIRGKKSKDERKEGSC